MKTKQPYAESSKGTLIARYLRETSEVEYGDAHSFHSRIDLKDLGKSMLASMEKLKEFSGFSRGMKS